MILLSIRIHREADLLIGGFDHDGRIDDRLLTSKTYIQDDMTWCVAAAGPRDLWRNVFNIFTTTTWIAIICFVGIMALTVNFFQKFENKNENIIWSFMISLAGTTGKTVNYETKKSSARIVLFLLFFYGLIISTSFSSLLISILTRPKLDHQVANLIDAVTAKYKFTGGESVIYHLLVDDWVNFSFKLKPKKLKFIQISFCRRQEKSLKILKTVLRSTFAWLESSPTKNWPLPFLVVMQNSIR